MSDIEGSQIDINASTSDLFELENFIKPAKKRPKLIYSHSVGQKFKLHQPVARDRKRERNQGINNPKEYITASKIATETFHLDGCISEFRGCVCSRKGTAQSCYLNMFFDENTMILDRNLAIISLRKFRNETKHKTEKELVLFTEKKILDCVIGQINERLEMKYELDGHEVCRDTLSQST
jgi:hypothetical protein